RQDDGEVASAGVVLPLLGYTEQRLIVLFLHGRFVRQSKRLQIRATRPGFRLARASRAGAGPRRRGLVLVGEGPPFPGSLLEPEQDGRLVRALLEIEDFVARFDLPAAG